MATTWRPFAFRMAGHSAGSASQPLTARTGIDHLHPPFYASGMLQSLRVKNLAIVENVRVDFGAGLNVITGETGAGKSVIVGALGLILGERADRTMIRSGETRYGVEASFHLADPSNVDTLLDELGIDACDEGHLLIRRVVTGSGSNQNTINDCNTTLQALKRVGDLLVDMHGPHDHQSLLSPAFQLDLLDSFGHLWKTRSVYEDLYAELRTLKHQRHELEADDQTVAQQLDMLSFQIKEIEAADLESLSEDELEREHTIAANASRILELAGAACNALTEDEYCAFNALVAAQRALEDLGALDKELAPCREDAASAALQVQEVADTLNRFVQSINADPDRLQWLEDRKALLHSLKRKYGSTLADILTFLKDIKERLHELETRGERLAALDATTTAVFTKLMEAGTTLSRERYTAAARLSELITEHLQDLGFEHGSFKVALQKVDPCPVGIDEADFGFAPNVGEPMRPLKAIASSGEISRVMLAVKTVLANHDTIPVLVFDEIDTNVGGEMGNAIGTKLAGVAESHQVICITHLPQVAVHGAHHFGVRKQVREGRTYTDIQQIEGQDRVDEIARMLSGDERSNTALQHAEELLGKRDVLGS